MPKGYHHLTYEQRCQINVLLKRGITQIAIASEIGVSQSSVSREVRRNKGKCGYRYKQAHKMALFRKNQSNTGRRKVSIDLWMRIEHLLSERQWSPKQISGALAKEGVFISYERIYQHIWGNKRSGGKLYLNLRNKGRKYTKRGWKCAGRGVIPNRIGIEQRPKIVDQRIRIGDLELDTIVGAKHKGAIVSIVDRKSKMTWLQHISRTTAAETTRAIISLLSPIKPILETLTADNGKEFSDHSIVSQVLGAKFYFARPYHAWERGLNENHNRLVRQYFPKGTDFSTISNNDVKYVEHLLNSRPRETLNFQTPIEVFQRLTNHSLNYALRP